MFPQLVGEGCRVVCGVKVPPPTFVGVPHITPGTHVTVATRVNVGCLVPVAGGVAQPLAQFVGVVQMIPGAQVGVANAVRLGSGVPQPMFPHLVGEGCRVVCGVKVPPPTFVGVPQIVPGSHLVALGLGVCPSCGSLVGVPQPANAGQPTSAGVARMGVLAGSACVGFLELLSSGIIGGTCTTVLGSAVGVGVFTSELLMLSCSAPNVITTARSSANVPVASELRFTATAVRPLPALRSCPAACL
jgi:hypothetical protein